MQEPQIGTNHSDTVRKSELELQRTKNTTIQWAQIETNKNNKIRVTTEFDNNKQARLEQKNNNKLVNVRQGKSTKDQPRTGSRKIKAKTIGAQKGTTTVTTNQQTWQHQNENRGDQENGTKQTSNKKGRI